MGWGEITPVVGALSSSLLAKSWDDKQPGDGAAVALGTHT